MKLPFLGHDMDCFPSSRVCLVCWFSQDPYSAFCFLIGIPTRPCPESQQNTQVLSSSLSPVTNYPALPQRNRRSSDYISYCYICAPASGDFTSVKLLCRYRWMLNPLCRICSSNSNLINNLWSTLKNEFTSL